MTDNNERLLRGFVDREAQVGHFSQIVTGAGRGVVAIWGESGKGKSSLRAKLYHEASLRGLQRSEVVVKSTTGNDYLSILRKIRDDLGASSFPYFTDRCNYFTKPEYEVKFNLQGANISIAENTKMVATQIDEMVGVKITDSNINIIRSDLGIEASATRAQLTEAFFVNLEAVATDKPIVILIDTIEKLQKDTLLWLKEDFVEKILCGTTKVVCCIFGQQNIELRNAYHHFNELIVEEELPPLGEAHIEEYLVNRGIDAVAARGLAAMLKNFTHGNPMQVALAADAFLTGIKK
ncbi:MAG: hypothetical protein SFV19_07460 [Rhodospirillaceae bacterium]|nr:hypothetical protein [Rhodospirillaceae bacterium]